MIETERPTQPHPLLLASSSPRRKSLLAEAGYDFTVAPPAFEEPGEEQHVSPQQHAESLAFYKASSLADSHADGVILAADTIAFLDGEIIGKPVDRSDAARILRRLSNTVHDVITGVALLDGPTGRRMIRHAVSKIRVRPLSDGAIEQYLDTGHWQGKAGAYGIQDRDDPFVEKLTGSFSNVVGLPMELLAQMFDRWLAGEADA